ncbi:MFS transporter [Actinomycetospora endophytica]|uniref:MFS transporter n=1 Tax=Actinomycetospora endophytica TaxID=2291215 RepID=A0ABS8PCS7_9PSEU|nr:MFS transporter [Actinomycetospora endophytica]MCD2196051.1 MFS transporter [Actinomycetospora endophytica]
MSQSQAESPVASLARARWWILAVIGVAQLMVILDNSIVNIALPSAQADLGFSDAQRQWVVTAYALAFGSLLLLGGRLSDLFGRKAAFVVGLVGFAAASVLGGLAPGFGLLVGARALQGAFGAVLAPAALSLLTTTFPAGRDRARAFGVFSALAGSGAAIGLLLGGTLTEYFDWRWCMYVNVVFAVVALVGALILLPAHPSENRPRLDIWGTLTASGGLFCIVFGFATAETDGWTSGVVYAFLAGGVVLLTAFVVIQRLVSAPLLPLRVLLDRHRGGSYLTILVLTTGMFGVTLFLAYVLQEYLGLSPVLTGVAMLPMVASIMSVSTTMPALLLPRIGPKPLIFVGLLLGAGALFWFSFLTPESTYAGSVLGPLILMGLGMGTAMSTSINTATLGVDRADAGVASATVNTMQQVGGSVGTALLSSIAGTATAAALAVAGTSPRTAAIAGYDQAFTVAAIIFVVGAVVCASIVPAGRPHAVPVTESTSGPATQELSRAAEDSWGEPGTVTPVARPVEGGLVGRVLDGNDAGSATAAATVTLIDATDGAQVGRARTAEDGSYALAVPRPGDYLLVCSAPGRRPVAERVRVAAVDLAISRDLWTPAG